MSKPLRLVLTGLAVVMLAGPRPAEPQEETPPPYAPGEILTYDVSWSVFTAGEVVAKLTRLEGDSQGAYEVITTARTTGVVDLLFSVRNEFRSTFDPKTLCSRRIWKWINEGRRHREIHIIFDPLRRLAIRDERDPTDPHTTSWHEENEIPECVADVISAFYVVRRKPLHVGEPFSVPINDGAKTYDVAIKVQERETIQTPLGARAAIRVEPKVFGGIYKRKGTMQIWFSDDGQRLPLRIKASLSVGSITGNLKSVTTAAAAESQSQ
jgi:hypothetical protein